MLLSDLGRELYLGALQASDAARADALMRDAVSALVHWQRRCRPRRCRPTTKRCWRASWRCFPNGACSASSACSWGEADEHALGEDLRGC